jgi:hypothetical protein
VRYLPRDLSVLIMTEDFRLKNPGIKISEETYRKIMKEENVSLCLPQSDSCDICVLLKDKVEQDLASDTQKEDYHKKQNSC